MDSQNLLQQDLDTIRSDVIELISQQRLLRLVEGGKFVKYSTKGQRMKDKFWICKLSPNHRYLLYGDIDENKKPQNDVLANVMNVSNIKRIIIGKECPHTKDGHMKKTSVDLAFTVIYEYDQEDCLNFVAVDHKTFCHWTDGLNSLLKADMTSDEFQKDLQILTKIEHKMRSMNK